MPFVPTQLPRVNLVRTRLVPVGLAGVDFNLPTSTGNVYLLDDEFRDIRAAGAVNGTPATPGPGTRVAGAGGSIGGGAFTLSGAATDTLWNNIVVARAFGQILLAKCRITDVTQIIEIGWDDNTNGAIGLHAFRVTVDTIKPYIGGVAGPTIFVPVDATDYTLAIVLRLTGAYFFIKGGTVATWRLLWVGATNNTTPLYAGISNTNAAGAFEFLRGPLGKISVPLLAYDTLTRPDGALGSTEAVGPDGQAITSRLWTGATWAISGNKAINTPTLGADLVSNGGMETGNPPTGWIQLNTPSTFEQSAAQAHSGTNSLHYVTDGSNEGAQQTGLFIVGSWYFADFWAYRVSGSYIFSNIVTWVNITLTTWLNLKAAFRANSTALQIASNSAGSEYYIDDVVCKALTLSELFSSITATHADVMVDVAITLASATFNRLPTGLVLRLDDAANPQNFLIVYINTDTAGAPACKLDKCVAGIYTNIITATITYLAGATLRAILNGSSVSIFYNNAQVGTTQTVSDAGILNNTLHGLFSTSDLNSLDNFAVYPIGTGNEYAALDRWSGVNP